MNFTPIIVAISLALGFGGAWSLRGHQIDKLKLEQANERISIQRAARATIERTSNAVIAAQNAAAGRVAVIKRNSDAVRVSADGLRDDLDVTRRAAASTIDACNHHAATVSELLIEAVAMGRELAQACDGHASDVRTLMDAWPKTVPK